MADLLDDVGLNPLGRFIQQQHLRPHDQRTGNRQLLLLTTRKVAAAPRRHVAQHREQVVDLGRDLVIRLGQHGKRGFQILTHRQQRKDHPPLRHNGKPARRHVLRPQLCQILPIQRHRTARPHVGARQRPQKAGLADAIRPHDAGHFARLGREIQTMEDLRPAIMQCQPFGLQYWGLQHHPRPR